MNQLFYKLSFGVLRRFQKVTDSNDISESFCNGLAFAWQALDNRNTVTPRVERGCR